MAVPYFRVLSDGFKKTCNSLGVQVHFKGSNTIYTLLVAPKDKDIICQKVANLLFQVPSRGLGRRIPKGIAKDLQG